MSQERNTEAQRLFDELIELDPTARELRLLKLAPDPTVSREVTSLLAAAERAGDFLGVLGATSAPETKRPAPGPLVAARYRLERALGSGSMGDVHLAWDQQLERPVALKFLRASSHADPSALPRFIAEARAAARLDHPHVATVHDFGETEQRQLFIAMAYYPGETLRDRIARGPLPAADALRIAAQIASALGAAHAAGIVHRDVKPANVLIDAEGAVKLTDFGIAKLSAEHDTTSPGVAVGTLAYMSPEQARGDAVDSRTDLWSLGVVLHEMIAGRRPFIGDNAAALVHALIHGDPAPLPEGDAQVGPALRALVAALLSKDPERRPDRASTVRQALERLAAGDDALPTRAAPGAGALPQAMTGFIGREREIALARGLLDDTRLLTLTGPGGTGKTRLALQLAASVRERHADGVWFVPLAEISDADLVPSMVAQTLGVRDLGATLLSDRVIAALRGKQILLVLDNFEHVLDAGAFVARLLGACPGVTVMATSRAPLAVQGEQEFPVPPLTTPSRADENAADSEAVRLFVQRARAVRPGFALDEAALDAVGEICRRLDGLPLALELAAARAKLLSPRAMLARLEHRFDLLRADARDRPARHSTMRAVIDWSYVLLTDAERALFDRLAVFAGGISVDAAEAVAPSRDGGTDAPPAVLDVLDSLCNKSLLRQDDQADGEPRFVMLETVREFGLERLRDSRGEDAARRAHRAYCIALAERAAGELRGPAQAAWFDRLEHEYANFRVALDDALAPPATGVADAARLAVALHRLWLTRGPLIEGSDYLRRIIAATDAPGAPVLDMSLRARLLGSAAQLAGTRSVFPEARDLFARSLALHREANDIPGVATTLNNLAWQVWNGGDLATGEAMSMEAMAMHRARGDELGVALSLNNLAWITTERGEFDRAEEYFEAAIASHQRRGDPRAAAFTTSWLGELLARRGEFARAIALHERALEMAGAVADRGYHVLVLARLAAARHAIGEPGDHRATLESECLPALRAEGRLWPIAYALTELGSMLMERGELAGARAAFEEALEVRHRTGGAAGIFDATMLLGIIHHRAGDFVRATELLGRALSAAYEYGAAPAVIVCLEAIAALVLDEGRLERSALLLGAAARARDALRIPRPPRYEPEHARVHGALAAALGDAQLARVRADGATMTMDEAVALALGTLRGS